MAGTVIPWRRFFHEVEETQDFAERLREKAPDHRAIALLVRVREIGQLMNGQHVARCTCVHIPDSDPPTFAGPSMFGSAEAMKGIKGKSALCRHRTLAQSQDRPAILTTRQATAAGCRNLSATIYQTAQYAEVNPPEE